MHGIFEAIVLSLAVCACNASYGSVRSRVDCAFSVWSEWTPHSYGQHEQRTRNTIRRAENGGQPCTGRRVEYRTTGVQPTAGPEEFLGGLLAGNRPSYSLGGGRRYTLSRDIVLVLDNTVDPVIFPYYKSFISNIVGKICGGIGSEPQDNILNVARFDRTAVPLHSFLDDQIRENIQDKILKIPNNFNSSADLKAGTDYARFPLTNEQSGVRLYNNATKEVLFVTSERPRCSRAFVRSARQLKTTAEVYVIVLGTPTNQTSCVETLASSESHFLRLEGVTEISQLSQNLLDQSPVNNFCLSHTSYYGHE